MLCFGGSTWGPFSKLRLTLTCLIPCKNGLNIGPPNKPEHEVEHSVLVRTGFLFEVEGGRYNLLTF